MPSPTELSAPARAILRLALAVLAIALLAAGWELLATQAPGSHLFIGTLPGPVASLREAATVAGLLLLSAAWLAPFAARDGEPRRLIVCMHVAALVGLGASVYAAASGMHAAQMHDPRPDALPVFVLKHTGLGVLFACLIELGRRAAFRQRRE